MFIIDVNVCLFACMVHGWSWLIPSRSAGCWRFMRTWKWMFYDNCDALKQQMIRKLENAATRNAELASHKFPDNAMGSYGRFIAISCSARLIGSIKTSEWKLNSISRQLFIANVPRVFKEMHSNIADLIDENIDLKKWRFQKAIKINLLSWSEL